MKENTLNHGKVLKNAYFTYGYAKYAIDYVIL